MHDNWNESSVFTELPGKNGGSIAQVSYPVGWYDWMTWDISSYNLTNDLIDDNLTLILVNNQGGAWSYTHYASSEYPDQSLIPYLEIQTTNAVPNPGDDTDGDGILDPK